jgi:hypothetical protein
MRWIQIEFHLDNEFYSQPKLLGGVFNDILSMKTLSLLMYKVTNTVYGLNLTTSILDSIIENQ